MRKELFFVVVVVCLESLSFSNLSSLLRRKTRWRKGFSLNLEMAESSWNNEKMFLTGVKVSHYMYETKREYDRIRWCFKTKKYISLLGEDKGRMRSSIYIRSFMHLENVWQARSTKGDCFSHGDLIVRLWKHGKRLEKDGSLTQNQI